jgi:hypothetical protein
MHWPGEGADDKAQLCGSACEALWLLHDQRIHRALQERSFLDTPVPTVKDIGDLRKDRRRFGTRRSTSRTHKCDMLASLG